MSSDTAGADASNHHAAATILFSNTSTSTCTLSGYPGAATLDATGAQLRQATRTLRGPLGGLPAGTNSAPTVTLEPGKIARVMIEGTSTYKPGAAQAGCTDTSPALLVTPPNTTTSTRIPTQWPKCETLEVHPVIAA